VQVTLPTTVYYVNALTGNDANDGLSPETAFATIQRAIDTTQDGDTVVVTPGTSDGVLVYLIGRQFDTAELFHSYKKSHFYAGVFIEHAVRMIEITIRIVLKDLFIREQNLIYLKADQQV